MSQGNPHEQITDPKPMGAGNGPLASLLDRFPGTLMDVVIVISAV